MSPDYRPEIVQSAFINFFGKKVATFWSVTSPKLRLIAKKSLSDELIALRFEMNYAFKKSLAKRQRHWEGGQHIKMSAVIDGVYYQRHYSLVGLPEQPLWWEDNKHIPTLTIAIKPQGVFSNYLAHHAHLGMIINSSLPSGDFTLTQHLFYTPQTYALPYNTPEQKAHHASLLFIASGSGITPMLGLIEQALQWGHPVTLIHYNRGTLLKTHWQKVALTYPKFKYYLSDTMDSSTYLANERYLSLDGLLTLDLPWAKTYVFACGNSALLTQLYPIISALIPTSKPLDHIKVEHFGSGANIDTQYDAEKRTTHKVFLRTRQRQFDSSTTLLLDAERAGIRLPYGCRQGICQLCRCNKVSGIVKNIHTGKLSGNGSESIQTCISQAVTQIVLDS